MRSAQFRRTKLKLAALIVLAPLLSGQDGSGCGLFDSSMFERTDDKPNIPTLKCSCEDAGSDNWSWGTSMSTHMTQEYMNRTGRTQAEDTVRVWLGEPRPDCLIYYNIKISSEDPIYPSEFSGYMDIKYDDNKYDSVKLDPIPLEFQAVDRNNLVASFRMDKLEQCIDPAAGEILQPFYHPYFYAVVERYAPAFDQAVRVTGEGTFKPFQTWDNECACSDGLLVMTNESSRRVEFVFERDSGGTWSDVIEPGGAARFRLTTGYYTMTSTIRDNAQAAGEFRSPERFYIGCDVQCDWKVVDPDVLYSSGGCVDLQ